MKSGNLLEAIIEISNERGLDQEAVIEAVKEAIVSAAFRKYKNYMNMEATFNKRTGEIALMHYRVVVEEVKDPDNEIHIDEVRKMDSSAEIGDEVEYEIENKEFSQKIAQTARQLIFQKIKEVEREAINAKFSERRGEILHGSVARIERNRIILMVNNNIEAILDKREQIPYEKFQPGENIRVYLLDILTESKGPQIAVSRTHPKFLMKLFEMEVPEIYDGSVEVVNAAREPGKRAKISVRTNDSDIDPVGACVGMRGARVQAVVNELSGERIDIIEWAEQAEDYIANALAPAEITRMKIDHEKHTVDVEVENDQLSLAIGKQGQNVRLASQLTGFKINVNASPNDIMPETATPPSLEETSDDASAKAEDKGEPTLSIAEGEEVEEKEEEVKE